MRFAFFPGCTIADRLPFIEKSIRMVAPEFDIELIDMEFTCCPEPNSVRSFSSDTWLTMAARNIAVAEEVGVDLLAACAGCFESLKVAKHKLDSEKDTRERTNRVLGEIGHEYKGSSNVLHLVQVLNEIGPEEIASRTVRKIPMRVVTHSGCHILRPQHILDVDSAEAPKLLDGLVKALGLEPLEYMDKTMCCGAGIRSINRDVSFGILRDKMDSMLMVEPEATVVFCPTCFISFEAGQRVVNRMFDREYEIPVYYYTELLAIAMDLKGTEMILGEHRVKSDLLSVVEGPEKRTKSSAV